LETKLNFPLTGKCFPLTNFSNDKQTHKSLESDLQKTTFRQTNKAFIFIIFQSLVGEMRERKWLESSLEREKYHFFNSDHQNVRFLFQVVSYDGGSLT
jgi:hypothetical protein